VFYYTKDIRKVLGTRQRVLAALIAGAHPHGVDLATPVLYQSSVATAPAPSTHPGHTPPDQQPLQAAPPAA